MRRSCSQPPRTTGARHQIRATPPLHTKDFLRLGVPLGEETRRAKLEAEIKAIAASPVLFAEDPLRKEFAKAVANSPRRQSVSSTPQLSSGLRPA